MRLLLFSNIPAPYRVPVYDRIGQRLNGEFRAVYMADAFTAHPRESAVAAAPGRPELGHEHVYLSGMTLVRERRSHGGRDLHLRFGVGRELRRFKPDVVLTGGFNPPMLAAWANALARRIPHVAVSDAWAGSETTLGRYHRILRKVVYSTSAAFVGASRKSAELFRGYSATGEVFYAPLSVDNDAYSLSAMAMVDRPYDVMFAGRLVDRKMPLFFVDVVKRAARRSRPLSVLIVGDGPLLAAVKRELSTVEGVRATFTGYLSQDALPSMYGQAKMLCFPSQLDAWGVVANEACATGMPVLTCSNVGCAGELIVHGKNGFVLALDPEVWADHVLRLLTDEVLLCEMARNAQMIVAEYTYEAAAEGVLAACQAALDGR